MGVAAMCMSGRRGAGAGGVGLRSVRLRGVGQGDFRLNAFPMGGPGRRSSGRWGSARRWRVIFIDGDVEAGLLELLFHVDFAGLFEGEQAGSHPGDFLTAEWAFGNVDSGAGEVRADDVAFGGGGIAVDPHESLLVGDGADRGAHFKGAVELGSVAARQVGEEERGPGAAIAVIDGQVAVDRERDRRGHRDQQLFGDAVGEIVFVFDALETFSVRHRVLMFQIRARANQRRRHPQARGAQRNGLDGCATSEYPLIRRRNTCGGSVRRLGVCCGSVGGGNVGVGAIGVLRRDVDLRSGLGFGGGAGFGGAPRSSEGACFGKRPCFACGLFRLGGEWAGVEGRSFNPARGAGLASWGFRTSGGDLGLGVFQRC